MVNCSKFYDMVKVYSNWSQLDLQVGPTSMQQGSMDYLVQEGCALGPL